MRSIRFRIILMLCFVFVVVMTVTTVDALVRRNEDIRNSYEKMGLLSKIVSTEQNLTAEHTRQLVLLLAEEKKLSEFALTKDCSRSLGTIVKRDRHLANVFITDMEGTVICSAQQAKNVANVSDRDFFRSALNSVEPVIGEPVSGRFTGKWVLPFAQRITDRNGNIQGLIVVALDLNWISQDAMQRNYQAGMRGGLAMQNGTVIARFPEPEKWVGRNISEFTAFKQMMAQGGIGTAKIYSHDGESRLYTFSHFAKTASGTVYWWASVPVVTVTASANTQFVVSIMVSLALIALTIFIAWYGGEKFLIKPLNAINEVADKLSQGVHNVKTGLQHTPDEIGKLAKTFDHMAVALQSNSEIVKLNRALRVMIECNRVLVHSKNEEELLAKICQTMVEVGGYRMAWVGLANHDESKSVMPIAFAGHNDGYLDHAHISWGDNERGLGPTGTAIRTGISQFNQNFEVNKVLAPWRDAARKLGFRASSALPLRSEDGSILGALTIYASTIEPFNDEEIRLLEELASDLAFGMSMLRMRQARDSGLLRLESSLEATVRAIASTLEMRDPYTAGHERRVAQLAVAIGKELGLPDSEIHGIQLAAEVHDLGKIQIPAEILSKPTRLTDLEYKMLQQHPETGYEILKSIDFPWPIAEMVRQHHERINGSGYPHGLKNDEILPGAKIIAVADVVEAMASHRPYRAALGVNVALDEIRKNRGVFFDQAVVDACIELFERKGFKFT